MLSPEQIFQQSLFHLPYPARSKQLPLLATAPHQSQSSLTMFMSYHVQQRMWLCDFDEFGLAEEPKEEQPAYSQPRVETCVIPL